MITVEDRDTGSDITMMFIYFDYLDEEEIKSSFKNPEEVKKLFKDNTGFRVTVKKYGRKSQYFYPTDISIIGPSYESGEIVQYNLGYSDFVKMKGEFSGKILPDTEHRGVIFFPRLRESGEWKIYYEDEYITLGFKKK